jgi:magnesium-transporting ATPase (P-type)
VTLFRFVWTSAHGHTDRLAINRFGNFFSILLYFAAAACFAAEAMQPGQSMTVLGWALVGVAVLNAVFAFIQEYRAERTMEALKKYLPQIAHVRRAGQDVDILADQIVPGDRAMCFWWPKETIFRPMREWSSPMVC